MINILLRFDGDMASIAEANNFQYTSVPEMTGNTYNLLLQDPDDFDAIEIALEAVTDIFMIGAYNEDGSQYIYGGNAAKKAKRNHNITKYTAILKNKLTFDVSGNTISDIPYTESEALNKQVNKWYGWGDRTL